VMRREEFRALAAFAILVAIASAMMVSSAFADERGPGRLNGPLGETANMYGGYLILNIGVALGLFLQARSGPARFGSAAAVVLLGLPLLYTYSRTSFVAIMVAALLFGILKDRRLLAVAVIVALLTPLIAPDTIWLRISSISGVATGQEPSSWISRTWAWQQAGHRADCGTARPEPARGALAAPILRSPPLGRGQGPGWRLGATGYRIYFFTSSSARMSRSRSRTYFASTEIRAGEMSGAVKEISSS